MQQTMEKERLNAVKDSLLKFKYLITGAVLANSIPVGILIPGLWALSAIYSLPLIVIERVFQLHGLLVTEKMIFEFPRMVGLFITVPFWSIIGASIGQLILHIQTKKGQSHLSLFQIINRVGGMLFGMIFVGYVVFMAISMLIYK